MKVLMTADTIGGVWAYSLELIEALAEHDVEVYLATMGAPLQPGQRRELASSAVAGVYSESFALEWMHEPWADVDAAGRWLLGIRDRVGPDLVHLNGYAHGTLPWETPLLVVGHSCVLSWFRAVLGEEAPPRCNRYAEVVRAGLAAADVVAAPTHALLDELLELYDPPGHAVVIPNGRSAIAPAREKEPFVLSAGRMWDEAKNVAALDRVAPSLPWPVVVAGDADTARRPEHVRLLGRLGAAALAEQMARASVYALPARYEPFGLSALEAALAGCALVLGDIPSLREVWGDAALFAPPDDDDALRDALVRVIGDEALRDELARRAYERASEYTPQRMAAGYRRAYALAQAEVGIAA